MKILIVHDWAIFRSGIKQILADEFGPQDVTEGAPVPEGFDMASGPWDLALVGVGMRGRKGLQVVAALKRSHPSQRVLALVPRSSISSLRRALQDSIQDAIAIESSVPEVVTAVRKAIAAARGAAPATADPRSEAEARSTRELQPSRREIQVLNLFANGKGMKEIATVLEISPKTVSTYRARLLRKLHFHSTADLIRYAFKHGIAE